tara:strand:- start:4688 stop:5452 length:765 start_codon:yes stop_codon:yes gene_type:complete
MNELALFAGAGGGILGGKLLGWRTICAVELDAYARKVLLARQKDGTCHPFPIWDDIRTFDGRPWAGKVDVISGGFPCQDISAAGKGRGIKGPKSGLWVEMERIISEVRPRHVFVENSPMLAVRGLGSVLGGLASLGYDARWGVLGACHSGAPHRRDRIWIVATNANRPGRIKQRGAVTAQAKLASPECHGWWSSEPDVGRVVNGLAHRVDRLRAIGNGQVPAVAALAWGELSDTDNNKRARYPGHAQGGLREQA